MSQTKKISKEINYEHSENSILQNEINALKKELTYQLNMREKELNDYLKLERKYKELEKKYKSLRTSTLGKVTVKYWRLRKRLSSRKDK